MTKDQEQRLFDQAMNELPDETNVLSPFYKGYVRGVLAMIGILRQEKWAKPKSNAP